jgi:hypothetical protein
MFEAIVVGRQHGEALTGEYCGSLKAVFRDNMFTEPPRVCAGPSSGAVEREPKCMDECRGSSRSGLASVMTAHKYARGSSPPLTFSRLDRPLHAPDASTAIDKMPSWTTSSQA